MTEAPTIEWFGATTFRLKACGLTIFLDAWLERPDNIPTYLKIEDVEEADYIFISHAHFDHLPGADRLARRTGAIVVANGEAVNLLAGAGIAEEQLIRVSGGERIPLFTKQVRQDATRGLVKTLPGPPGAPTRPDHGLAVMSVQVWPSLHCLLPTADHSQIPETFDTGTIYNGSDLYACSIDITTGMRHGLLKLDQHIPPQHRSESEKSFIKYIKDDKNHAMSAFDGGQLTFSFLIGTKTLLWNAHLGAYKGILQYMEPKPDVLILAVAGRANIDGRPFDGSGAQAASLICQWLGEPRKIIWCLHDESPIKPFRVDVASATELVEKETRCKVSELVHAKEALLFE